MLRPFVRIGGNAMDALVVDVERYRLRDLVAAFVCCGEVVLAARRRAVDGNCDATRAAGDQQDAVALFPLILLTRTTAEPVGMSI
jgi:hypothetical protein